MTTKITVIESRSKQSSHDKDKPRVRWIKPTLEQLEREWEQEVEFQKNEEQVPLDVRRYLLKHFPTKEAWFESVKTASVVTVPVELSKTIRNTPDDKEALLGALSPDSPDPEGPAKAKRVNDLFKRGEPIPMPIIVKAPRGLWLIGGKTRLGTARYIHEIPARVLLIGGDQQDLE